MISPKVTVLTTVYNGLPYLREAIESILDQTYSDFEFLIIDDASTDESLECIKSYKDSRIRLLQNEINLGQVASLNRGLKEAIGRLIARFDQDDVSLPNRLEEQIRYMEENQSLTIICSWEYTIDSSGGKVRTWESNINNYGDFIGHILLGLCPVWHPSVMFHKDAVLELGGFDTSYAPAEDYQLWGRIAVNRLNAGIVPKFHLLQRVHNQRQSVLKHNIQVESTRRAHREFICKFVSGQHIDCLASLLRLEKDACGKKYDRQHVIELDIKLREMFENIEAKQNLSLEEYDALKKKIYRRVGLGVRHGELLARFPSVLFYPIFYMLSPMLLTDMRAFGSKINCNAHKLLFALKRN